jgi:hypothetical protein
LTGRIGLVEARCGNIVAPLALTADFVVLASLENSAAKHHAATII